VKPITNYLTSLTNEKDPKLRDEKLRKYAEEVSTEFGVSSAAADPRQAASASETPEIIYLPPPTDKVK